jgi:chromosome segregation ATPase
MEETFKTPETPPDRPASSGDGWKWPLVGVLAIALAGNIFLLVRSNNLSDQISSLQAGTDGQFSKISAAADATQEESRKQLAGLAESLNTYHSDSKQAVTRVQTETRKQGDQIKHQIEEQKEAISGEISEVKTKADDANNKLTEVSSDVGNVKTDVSGVKTEVTGVKTDLATAQTALNQHSEDLKRMVGDMGAMSGLIATNSKDLVALRELGERNYYEFTLTKAQKSARVGDMNLTLKKADAKNNRFTLDVAANDTHVEKRDRTINEPVQIYMAGEKQPHEIVINEVKKDQVVGYLSTPKVSLSRR